MKFLVIYLLAMLVPGAALVDLLRAEVNRTGLSIALSLSILVLTLVVAKIMGFGITGYGYLLLSVYLLIAICWLQWRRVEVTRRMRNVHPERVWVVPIGTFCVLVGYLLWVGPYLEVPADAWWHVGKINDALEEVRQDHLESVVSVRELFGRSREYFYIVVGLFIHVSGQEFDSGIHILPFANTLLFCLGVYAFAIFISNGVVDSKIGRHWVAAASVFFFVAHFGVNVFSYVRYYAYAPTILNYIVYLTAVSCFIHFLKKDNGGYGYGGLTAVFAVVAAMLHLQEAVFIAVMASAILLVHVLKDSLKRFGTSSSHVFIDWQTVKTKSYFLFGVMAAGYVAIHGYSYMTIERSNPLDHGLLVDIRTYIPFFQNLFVLRPTHQFYEVVTVWGVLVYVLFIVRRTQFRDSPYIVAGMAVPVLTVFNPVFADFFLRFASAETFWRMCYMIPLPFVGGIFIVQAGRGLFRGEGIGARLNGALLLVLLLVLLWPIQSTYFNVRHSRVLTLQPVDAGNDHRVWQDLVDYLNKQEKSGIITDRVTGYVVNGLTSHKYRGYKFYELYAPHVNKESYEDAELWTKNGWKRLISYDDLTIRMPWLVVINERDGMASSTGERSGHWPADIMNVSTLYSDGFRRYIARRSDVFKRVWNNDDIVVYKVEAE